MKKRGMLFLISAAFIFINFVLVYGDIATIPPEDTAILPNIVSASIEMSFTPSSFDSFPLPSGVNPLSPYYLNNQTTPYSYSFPDCSAATDISYYDGWQDWDSKKLYFCEQAGDNADGVSVKLRGLNDAGGQSGTLQNVEVSGMSKIISSGAVLRFEDKYLIPGDDVYKKDGSNFCNFFRDDGSETGAITGARIQGTNSDELVLEMSTVVCIGDEECLHNGDIAGTGIADITLKFAEPIKTDTDGVPLMCKDVDYDLVNDQVDCSLNDDSVGGVTPSVSIQQYYPDNDSDGIGAGDLRDCVGYSTPPSGYSSISGDPDDNDARVPCGSDGSQCECTMNSQCNNGKICSAGKCVNGASSQCDDSHTIMRLFQDTNSHGALWNYTSDIDGNGAEDYGVRVCSLPSVWISHECGSGFKLWMRANNNSHISTTNANGYNVPICFGSALSCIKRTSCNADETAIVSLSGDSNAHISDGNDANYPNKICCKSSAPGIQISGTHWASMINDEQAISSAILGARVKLIVSGAEMQDKSINYTVYKTRGGFLGTILGLFIGDIKVAQTSSKGFTTWRTSELGEFSFRAKVAGVSEEFESGPLEVADGIIEPPYVQILGVKDRQMYFLGESLKFIGNISDANGYVNYTWKLETGVAKKGDTMNYTNYNFSYIFSTPGQKTIDLEAVNEQGKENKDRVSILVLNSSFILAYIDEPRWGESIPSRIVQFDASSTYAVNYTHSSGGEEITCLAGSCPSQSEGCPPPLTGCRVQVSGTPNDIGFSNINFSWIFDNGNGGRFEGKGKDGAVFNKTFNVLGSHTAFLRTSLNPESSIDSLWYNFFGEEDKYYCMSDEEETYWVKDENMERSFNDCHRNAEQIAEFESQECCPLGYDCVDNKCIETGVYDCSGYSTQTDCGNYSQEVADADIEAKTREGYCGGFSINETIGSGGETCWNMVEDCRCAWKSGDCRSNYTVIKYCGGETGPTLGGCEFATTSTGECSLGYRAIRWEAYSYGELDGAECKDGERQIPCPVQLGFFSVASVAIAIVLIIVFYVIISRKKKELSRAAGKNMKERISSKKKRK